MISETLGGNKPWLERPRLRPVEVIPVNGPDGEALALHDPQRLAPRPIFLAPGALALLPLFDGSHDLRDIQAEIMKSQGQMIEMDALRGLIATLDEQLFLEGATFQNHLNREKEAFAALPVRRAVLAGAAYEADPDRLKVQLGSFYKVNGNPIPSENKSAGPLPRGLVAPHIDFGRGGACYADAFSNIDPAQPPDLVVILGVAHGPTEQPFALCGKDFDTPFGPAVCDKPLAERLIAKAGGSVSLDELVHRNEHSAEFMAVWVKYLWPEANSLKILPLLCGTFHFLVEEGREPQSDDQYLKAISALKDLVDEERQNGRKVLILSGADLSHVGPQFGDEFKVTEEVAGDIRAKDLKALSLAEQGDYMGFFEHISGAGDQTHICGLPSIYALLHLLEGPKGDVVKYEQWVDENGHGMVTFAGLVFP